MAEMRVDAVDGCAYTWEDLWCYYRRHYSRETVSAYWSCCPLKRNAAGRTGRKRGRWVPAQRFASLVTPAAAEAAADAATEAAALVALEQPSSLSSRSTAAPLAPPAAAEGREGEVDREAEEADEEPLSAQQAASAALLGEAVLPSAEEAAAEAGAGDGDGDGASGDGDGDGAGEGEEDQWSRQVVRQQTMEPVHARQRRNTVVIDELRLGRNTEHVIERVAVVDTCPIRLTPMFDPARVIHEDEEQRGGQPPHVMSRGALERWLGDGLRRQCPLCRGRITRIVGNEQAEVLALASQRYSGGENLAHKAVKLLDSGLLLALVQQLPADRWREMLMEESDEHKAPLDLLEEHEHQARLRFLEDLPDAQEPRHLVDGPLLLVHSADSAAFGGSALWSDSRPVRVRDELRRGDHESFVLLAAIPEVQDSELDSPTSSPTSRLRQASAKSCLRWGLAVVLHLRTQFGQVPILGTCPINKSWVGGRADGGMDEEVYEPAIRVHIGSQCKIFKGRLAAHRGIWIGGTGHFDDFVVDDVPGAAALLTYDPPSSTWRLHSAASRVAPMVVSIGVAAPRAVAAEGGDLVAGGGGESGDAAEAEGISEDEVVVSAGTVGRATIAVCPGGACLDVRLEPCFTARRMVGTARAEILALTSSLPVTLVEAQRLRSRVVLVQLRAEMRRCEHDPLPCYQVDQLGAVVSDYIIGRQEGCALEISSGGGLGVSQMVSRSHCVLQLRAAVQGAEGAEHLRAPCPPEGGALEQLVLVAFDDGSLSGTSCRGQRLGIGPGDALEVGERDALQLGALVTVRLRRVSPVLRLDDHDGLAAFFSRAGEHEISRTLTEQRPQRRATEVLLSSTMSRSRRMSMPASERLLTAT